MLHAPYNNIIRTYVLRYVAIVVNSALPALAQLPSPKLAPKVPSGGAQIIISTPWLPALQLPSCAFLQLGAVP